MDLNLRKAYKKYGSKQWEQDCDLVKTYNISSLSSYGRFLKQWLSVKTVKLNNTGNI